MHPKRNPVHSNNEEIRSHAHNSDASTFFNLLTGPELVSEIESLSRRIGPAIPPNRDPVDVSRPGAQCRWFVSERRSTTRRSTA